MRCAVLLLSVVLASLAHEATGESSWTTPLKEGDTVPQVEFQTRVRIESEDENPFDWKGWKGERSRLS